MRFIKVIILIFLLSTNLMLGQKTEFLTDKKCVNNFKKKEMVELRILQLQPNLIEQFSEGCVPNAVQQVELLDTGAFFRFVAF